MSRLDTLIETACRYDQQKSDQKHLATQVYYNERGALVLPGDGLFAAELALPLTPWARLQICERLKIPHKYLSRCPGPLQAANLNHWQQKLPAGKQWLVRTNKGQARAVLSEHYSIVDNSNVLTVIQELLAHVPFELVRPHLDADQMHLKLTTNESRDGSYRIGCYVSNNEIGGGAIVVAPFIQRTSCTNSIIYVEGGVRRAHFRLHQGFVRALLKHEIAQALQFSTGMLDNVLAAETDILPDIATIVTDISKRKGFNQQTQADILIGTEGQRTRMGLVNGLSFAAHATADLPVETRVGLEMLAGAVLQSPEPLAQVVGSNERWLQATERQLSRQTGRLREQAALPFG